MAVDKAAKQAPTQSAFRDQLCQALPVCVTYKSARNDCALVASFDNRLRIRIGGTDYDKLMFCNDDGTLVSVRAEQPSARHARVLV